MQVKEAAEIATNAGNRVVEQGVLGSLLALFVVFSGVVVWLLLKQKDKTADVQKDALEAAKDQIRESTALTEKVAATITETTAEVVNMRAQVRRMKKTIDALVYAIDESVMDQNKYLAASPKELDT